MTSSRLRHTGSVALLAMTASSGAALAAAGPAAADVPVPSSGYSLSIAVAQQSINPGASDTVSGVLTHAGAVAAGDTVYLRARPNGKHHGHRVASGMTDPSGGVSFTVTPDRTTHYRLVFRLPTTTPVTVPTATTPTPVVAARSTAAVVHVLRDSSLSIRTRTSKSGHSRIMGQLRGGGHALAHRQIALQERAVGGTTWTTVKTHHSNRHGMVNYGVVAPAAPEEFQLVFAGGPNFNGSQSGVVTVG